MCDWLWQKRGEKLTSCPQCLPFLSARSTRALIFLLTVHFWRLKKLFYTNVLHCRLDLPQRTKMLNFIHLVEKSYVLVFKFDCLYEECVESFLNKAFIMLFLKNFLKICHDNTMFHRIWLKLNDYIDNKMNDYSVGLRYHTYNI